MEQGSPDANARTQPGSTGGNSASAIAPFNLAAGDCSKLRSLVPSDLREVRKYFGTLSDDRTARLSGAIAQFWYAVDLRACEKCRPLA